MIGVIFLSVVALWAYISFLGARFLARRIVARLGRRTLMVVLTPVLFLAPIADEIVARFQFDELCKRAEVSFPTGKAPASGTSVKSVVRSERVLGVAVPIRRSWFSYRDAISEIEVMRFSEYVASGGWLIRLAMRSESPPPMTFQSTCTPIRGLNIGLKFVS